MALARDRIRALRVFPSVLVLFFAVPNARPQTPPPAAQQPAKDVVMLSLEALNPRVELGRHLREGLIGDSAATLTADQRLLELQMNIVRATAKFGPVLLFTPDEATKTALHQRCQEFQICELLKSDQVRIRVVVHDGVWIRDSGPQIENASGSAHVVHWRYFDIRAEQAKREAADELETARLKLLQAREEEDQPGVLTHDATPDARKAAVSAIDDKLYLLRQYSQILSEASPQRTNDEDSAYDVADAVLSAPDFDYKSSPLALDGGNLFKLEDGRCLATRVLLSRNKEQNVNVDHELQTLAGCAAVTYLEPLPGPVIEHIDMFALPVGGKKVLLASYDLSSPFAAEYWSKLSDQERDLALDAYLAMESDARNCATSATKSFRFPRRFPESLGHPHLLSKRPERPCKDQRRWTPSASRSFL